MRNVKALIPCLALALLGSSLVGCGSEASQACTEEIRASVNVTVHDSNGAAVEDATVSFSVDGGASTSCQGGPQGQYACGEEITGSFVITATRGAATASATVTVEDEDSCHVHTEEVTITIP
jgi:hypothetical protein